jgi:ribosome-binding protein aMBF1 (putative translation factor)
MMKATQIQTRPASRHRGAISPLGDTVTDDAEYASDPAYRRARDRYAVAGAVAYALIRFRVDRGLTQKGAAQALGMTESMVCRLERGDHIPNVDTMLRVAEATGTVLRIAFDEPAAANHTNGKAGRRSTRRSAAVAVPRG